MTGRWYIQDNHCLLDGLIRKSFWSAIRALVTDGEARLAGSLLEALQAVIANRSQSHYPSAEDLLQSVKLYLIEMPYISGGGWALGIGYIYKDVPWHSLVMQEPLRYSRPLVVQPQPLRPLSAMA